uniref:Uncharacterized protein n=1 Tax=uncultured myxobacterium HF0200_19H16 TaxID=723559 RepID=E7C3W9_9BACT|nr:hypothetical protein [uncultured myxobacterium HF0200_19H16]
MGIVLVILNARMKAGVLPRVNLCYPYSCFYGWHFAGVYIERKVIEVKKRFFHKTLVGLLLSLVLAPTQAGATTVVSRSEVEMAKHATAIVRAKVISVQSRWHSDNLIVTDVVLQALNVLKWTESFKKQSQLFRMVQLGGTIGGKTLKVPGTSEYVPGEEVLIFMESGAGDLVEMGVGAGKYSIDRSGIKPTITRRLSGVAMATVKGKVATLGAPRADGGAEFLDDFESRILSLLQPTNGGGR